MPYSPTGRPAKRRERRAAGVRVRDGARGMPGTGVIAHEERHIEASVGRRLDHAQGLAALDQAGPVVDRLRGQVVHRAVAVVDDDLGRAAVECTRDGRVRLAVHQPRPRPHSHCRLGWSAPCGSRRRCLPCRPRCRPSSFPHRYGFAVDDSYPAVTLPPSNARTASRTDDSVRSSARSAPSPTLAADSTHTKASPTRSTSSASARSWPAHRPGGHVRVDVETPRRPSSRLEEDGLALGDGYLDRCSSRDALAGPRLRVACQRLAWRASVDRH